MATTECLEQPTPAVLSLREKLDPGHTYDASWQRDIDRLHILVEVLREIAPRDFYGTRTSGDGPELHIGWIDFLRFFKESGLAETTTVNEREQTFHYKLYKGVIVTAIED